MLRLASYRVLALASVLVAAPLQAQATAAATAGIPANCTYRTCALRLEQAWSMRILRGENGQRVSSVGGFGSGVDVLLEGPPAARRHALEYRSASRVASTIGLLATASYIFAIVRANQEGSDDDAARIAGAAATGLAIVAIPFGQRAQRALSRSIWQYNAALADASR